MNRGNLIPTVVVLLLASLGLAACTGQGHPEGWPTGVVAGSTLYTGTMDGDFRALDTETGETRWRFQLRGEDPNRAFYGTPAIADEALYISAYDGMLYALTLNGEEIWDIAVGNADPIVGSPVVADGLVLVGSSDGNLYAFDTTFGSLHWSFQTGNDVWSTPTVLDGVAYFGSLDHNVYAVDLRDGTEIWRFPAKGAVAATPLVIGGRVYVGSFGSVFFALDAKSGRTVWQFDGADKWYWSGAAVHRNTIFAPSLDGNVYALDIDTGELKWTLHTDGPVVGSPVVVLDRLATASADGRLRLVRLGDGLDERQCNIGGKLRASLAVQENVLYLTADDHSIRALTIKPNGNPDEKWVHYTNEEPPVLLDWIRAC